MCKETCNIVLRYIDNGSDKRLVQGRQSNLDYFPVSLPDLLSSRYLVPPARLPTKVGIIGDQVLLVQGLCNLLTLAIRKN